MLNFKTQVFERFDFKIIDKPKLKLAMAQKRVLTNGIEIIPKNVNK